MSGRARSWKDEFLWLGTRDLTGFLSIPSAIDFLHKYGLERFRHETHELARYARLRLEQILGTTGLCVDSQDWYGSMVTIPLPDCVNVPGTWTGKPHPLQTKLAEDYRIEVPIVKWGHRMHIRVSCHLYNTQQEIDQLCEVLQRELNF